MIKNAALVTFTFAILAFCSFGRAQDQEPTIDSTIVSSGPTCRQTGLPSSQAE